MHEAGRLCKSSRGGCGGWGGVGGGVHSKLTTMATIGEIGIGLLLICIGENPPGPFPGDPSSPTPPPSSLLPPSFLPPSPATSPAPERQANHGSRQIMQMRWSPEPVPSKPLPSPPHPPVETDEITSESEHQRIMRSIRNQSRVDPYHSPVQQGNQKNRDRLLLMEI